MTEEVIQVVEVNCETGEEIYRPMTAEELAQREEDRLAWEALETQKLEAAAALVALKASAKAKLVAGQPLTEEEAAILII